MTIIASGYQRRRRSAAQGIGGDEICDLLCSRSDGKPDAYSFHFSHLRVGRHVVRTVTSMWRVIRSQSLRIGRYVIWRSVPELILAVCCQPAR
jgi:hypothetical protein